MGSGTSCYSAASSPIGCSTPYAYRVRFERLIADNKSVLEREMTTTSCKSPHAERPLTVPLPCLRRLVRWTQGTPLYRLRTPVAEIAQALLLVMRRSSLRAAEEVTGHKYETIGHWLHLAAQHAEALTEVLVHDLHLSTVEIDEFWSFVRRRVNT